MAWDPPFPSFQCWPTLFLAWILLLGMFDNIESGGEGLQTNYSSNLSCLQWVGVFRIKECLPGSFVNKFWRWVSEMRNVRKWVWKPSKYIFCFIITILIWENWVNNVTSSLGWNEELMTPNVIANGRQIHWFSGILPKNDHFRIKFKFRQKWDRIYNWQTVICLQKINWQNDIGTFTAYYEYFGLLTSHRWKVESCMTLNNIWSTISNG